MKYILCFLGFHKWINSDKDPYPKLEPNEFRLLTNLHKCERCKKEKYLGMGWYS